MTRTFGLELMESILKHYPKAFLDVRNILFFNDIQMLLTSYYLLQIKLNL